MKVGSLDELKMNANERRITYIIYSFGKNDISGDPRQKGKGEREEKDAKLRCVFSKLASHDKTKQNKTHQSKIPSTSDTKDGRQTAKKEKDKKKKKTTSCRFDNEISTTLHNAEKMTITPTNIATTGKHSISAAPAAPLAIGGPVAPGACIGGDIVASAVPTVPVPMPMPVPAAVPPAAVPVPVPVAQGPVEPVPVIL